MDSHVQKLRLAVDRKTDVTGLACGFLLGYEINQIKLFYIWPAFLIHIVQQVKVKIIHIAFGKLFCKNLFRIFSGIAEPCRQFVCEHIGKFHADIWI